MAVFCISRVAKNNVKNVFISGQKKGIKSTNGIQIETPFPHQCNTGNKNIHHMSHGYLKKKLTINVNKAYWVENHHFLSAAEKKKSIARSNGWFKG